MGRGAEGSATGRGAEGARRAEARRAARRADPDHAVADAARLRCSLQTARSCGAGGAFVSDLREEAQSKMRRVHPLRHPNAELS